MADRVPQAIRTPPGRHPLPREFITQHQRARIIAALAAETVDKGYRAVTVADIVRRAGIARNTFYENFSSKEDCFLAASEYAVKEALRRVVDAASKLPRTKPAPIAVFVSGHVGTADRSIPPQLKRLTVEVNRAGLLQSKGLPVCQIPKIQPASTERALSNCGPAVIGSGRFWAHIVLPGQRPYPTRGRLLVFNGRRGGRPVLLAHIYTRDPFASSFVIPFAISRIGKGPYGTQLSASLPQALGDWGYVDRIKLTLRRKYRHRGAQRSYFNAACPAPKVFKRTAFALAKVTFGFAGRRAVSVTVSKSCAVAP